MDMDSRCVFSDSCVRRQQERQTESNSREQAPQLVSPWVRWQEAAIYLDAVCNQKFYLFWGTFLNAHSKTCRFYEWWLMTRLCPQTHRTKGTTTHRNYMPSAELLGMGTLVSNQGLTLRNRGLTNSRRAAEVPRKSSKLAGLSSSRIITSRWCQHASNVHSFPGMLIS